MKFFICVLLLCFSLSCFAEEPMWKLAFVGDTMMGSNYPNYNLSSRPQDLLKNATPYLQDADIAIGNLEGALTTVQQSGKSNCTTCYAFRSPPHYAKFFKDGGFDGFSQANNHAMDFGMAGLKEGHVALEENGIVSTGWQGGPPALFQVKGQKVCLLAFAPNRGMNDLRDVEGAKEKVKKAKLMCPLVIVSFHGGAEGSDKSHTPVGSEYYLGENRGNVRVFSHAVVDAGASIVFGHGPHVPRGMEVYKGRLIAYSLGNFMTYGGMNVSGNLGLAPLLLVEINKEGFFQKGQIISFRQKVKSPVALDEKKAAFFLMKEKTQLDFNGGGLVFDEDGGFVPRGH